MQGSNGERHARFRNHRVARLKMAVMEQTLFLCRGNGKSNNRLTWELQRIIKRHSFPFPCRHIPALLHIPCLYFPGQTLVKVKRLQILQLPHNSFFPPVELFQLLPDPLFLPGKPHLAGNRCLHHLNLSVYLLYGDSIHIHPAAEQHPGVTNRQFATFGIFPHR